MKIAPVIWPKAYHYIGLAEMVLEPVSSPTLFPPCAVIRAALEGRAKVKTAQLVYHLGLGLVVK